MRDPRIDKLADLLVNYSVKAEKNQKIQVRTKPDGLPLARAVVEKIIDAGAIPFETILDTEINTYRINNFNEDQMEEVRKYREKNMKEFSGSIAIMCDENINDSRRLDNKNLGKFMKSVQRINDYRSAHTNWVLLNYPNASKAQQAGLSTKEYEDFLLRVSTIDYEKFSELMTPLYDLMCNTDKVQIKKNNGTDLIFSIKGIGAQKCDGQRNIPDGEVFSAPVRESINGTIVFNTEREYNGAHISNVSVDFKDGKAINAVSETDNERFQEILNIDEGARYVGEFAFGLHPFINDPVGDLLFDEKINGSIHLALGKCIGTTDNNNHSANHMDIVQIHRPEHGGGEVYFDDILIMKDGNFVLKELKPLNAENLRKELA